MFKNIFKIVLLGFFCFGFQFLNASSVVNDGFAELQNGNTIEAINIFFFFFYSGASSGCYNLGLLFYKGE